MREAIDSNDQCTWVQLDTEAASRRDQRSFHIFAEPDAERAFATCARLADHPDFGVRGNAMLGFGHIARRHRLLDERALPMIEAGLQDSAAWVRGQADSAADEVQTLLGWEIERPGA